MHIDSRSVARVCYIVVILYIRVALENDKNCSDYAKIIRIKQKVLDYTGYWLVCDTII